MIRCCASLPLLCLLLALPLTGPIRAQDPSRAADDPEARLHGAVRSTTRTALAGSVPPQARRAPDLGHVPADYPLHGITLVLSRSPAQQSALDQLLADQQNPASPGYHHWLTPDQFAARFGAGDSDLQAVEAWLTAQGFTLVSRSHSRDRITFSGTAALVTQAFGASLRRLQIEGEPHIAPTTDFTLPTDLAAITAAILHLTDLRPQPQLRTVPKPALTTATQQHFLGPEDMAVLYDFPTPNTTNILPGQGQTIAVLGQTYVNPGYGPIQTFQQANDLGNNITSVLMPGTGIEEVSPGDAGESDLDLEYAAGVSPGASVLFVHVGNDQHYDVYDALAFAIDQNLASILSISYGSCEPNLSASFLTQFNAALQQAAVQGQTVITSSGDLGATACARYPTSATFTESQQQVLAIDFPADSPLVTSVGGTQLAPGTFDAGSSAYWKPYGPEFNQTVLSYIPEVAWNEGSATRGLLAGGGGASAVFARPPWQLNLPGIPAGTTRLSPDIALQASVNDPGFAFCTDDSAFLGSSDPGLVCSAGLTNTYGDLTLGGGTSFSAPIFAAMVAILNQTTNQAAQGNLNPLLYATAATTPAVFHDIVTGNTECAPGTPRCGAPGQANFLATAGYDEATGLGSLDLTRLINALPVAPNANLNLTYIDLAPASSAANPGDDVFILAIVTATASSGAAASPPTGTLTISLDGSVIDSNVPFTGGYATGNTNRLEYFAQAPTAPGSHLVTVTYSGDSLHTPSTATYSILVGNVVATGTVALAAINLSLAANTAGTSAVSITPTGYNGRLFWSLALTASSDGSSLAGCYSIPSVAVDGPTATTLSLGLGTACNSAFPDARGQRRALPALRGANTPPPTQSHPTAVTLAAGLLLLGLLPVTRRRPLPLLLLLLLTAAIPAALTGCGSGSSNSPAPTPTPTPAPSAVTYTLTLTGQDSVNTALQSTTTFTLTTP